MDWAYDGQVKRYLTQFMRIMSNFSYKDAKGQLVRIPVRYGDLSRQVGAILNKNSENVLASAPFIACYIKDLLLDDTRRQDPTFVSKVQVRERLYDPTSGHYVDQQGSNYTVERIMPTPYLATFAADIWTTNTDQKLQIWEQIAVLFNPSLELQTTDNYIDWTSISVLTLKSQTFTSRQVPQGLDQAIDILNMNFETHVWITPPVKVKQLGIITKIIASAFTSEQGVVHDNYLNSDAFLQNIGTDLFKSIITPGDYDLLVLDNVATLCPPTYTGSLVEIPTPDNHSSWLRILDLYPGKFRAGLSQLRLTKPNGNEIVAAISLDPTDERRMILVFDRDTVPSDTGIDSLGRRDTDPAFDQATGRGTINAIVNPETFNPIVNGRPVAGTRYLILENINVNNEYNDPGYSGPNAWKNLDSSDPVLYANDIIEWNGSQWIIIFNSLAETAVTYITNSYTGVQYKWEHNSWSKSFEGIYSKELWRIVL
jgi:hypothetical protein